MLKKSIFLILVFILGFLNFNFVFAQSGKTEIHFFYSETCPHCSKEKEFLKELKLKYPEIEIKKYEIISKKLIPNLENQEILEGFYKEYQVPKQEWGRVPATFTSDRYFIGFNEQIGREIENCLKECLGQETKTSEKIKLPFLGEIDISKMSLPLLTIIIAGLDGFNPCAMWILLVLIALLINTHSRKRMLLVGGVFIFTSGIVYFLILSAWLNLFLAMKYVGLIRILIGMVALGTGIWQIQRFIRYKKGVCPVINSKSFQGKIKNILIKQAEKIIVSSLTLGIVGGIIFLAFSVNLIEFFCSAGLPAIYTKILSLSSLDNLTYYLYLLLYTFIFMLDDLIIFSLAIFAVSRIGFSEKYNYWATLIGGLLMLVLGILLIFKPEFLMFG